MTLSASPDAHEHTAELLQLLVENARTYAVFSIDAEGLVRTWNTGAERLYGWRAEEIVGRPFATFFRSDDADAQTPLRDLEAACATGQIAREGWRVRKDGKEFWANVVLRPLRAASGTACGHGVMTHDLTSLRSAEVTSRWAVQAEAARVDAEEKKRQVDVERNELAMRLEVILANVSDGIVALDGQGRLVFANDAAARSIGYDSAAEMVERVSSNRHDASSREYFDEAGAPVGVEDLPGQRALRGEVSPEAIVRVRDTKSGRQWWAAIRSSCVVDAEQRPTLVVTMWRDVTAERRRTEFDRYLSETTAVLASSLDYEVTLKALAQRVVPTLADWCSIEIVVDGKLSPLAVAHVDPKKLQFVKEMTEKYPPRPNEARGGPHVVQTGRSEFYSEIPRGLLESAAVDDQHLAMIRALDLRSAMIVPLIAHGRTLGVISFVGAESGRIYDAADLSLAEEIGRRGGIAVDNARLYRDAQRAIQVRDDFLSIAGHELNTPLAALLLRVDGIERLAEKGVLSDDPERVRQRLHHIAEIGKRLGLLVARLLDVSRISAGRLDLERSDFDLVDLTREVIERHRGDLADAGCSLTFDVAGPVVGRWDRVRLDQVLTNLLTNALKYGRGAAIEVRVARTDDRARWSVCDHGIGIATVDLERIFERFERAVSSRNYGGFGVGLWVAREIVVAHGGSIHVSSQPGDGAIFVVELPV